jgi:aldose 1-epimerase
MPRFSSAQEWQADTNLRVLRLFCKGATPRERSSIAFAPEMGSNLLSLVVGEQEYLVAGDQLAGAFHLLGTPILYPMPNRVRGGRFSFDGREYVFPPNNGPNFIHGLVRDRAWVCDPPRITAEAISVTTRFRFEPGSPAYALFPIRNTLELTYSLRQGSVRLDFSVYNEDDAQRLAFGLAIHPYFAIIGRRDEVRIQSPARYWMEAVDLLPTGRLLDLADGPADLRQPTLLEGLNLDDVFCGLSARAPQTIYYDAIGTRLLLSASDLFTHSVIYTPRSKLFFCIENQSCSTDAHNLHVRGLERAAHLTILDPGQACASWVEFSVSAL